MAQLVARTAGGREVAGSSPVTPTKIKCMTQRIVVRAKIVSGNRMLLVRRAGGRDSVKGKYELPGGRVKMGEQPDDAIRRVLLDSVGLHDISFRLDDAMTYQDSDDHTLQYAVIVYRSGVGNTKRRVVLGEKYDKYLWYTFEKLDQTSITEMSKVVMGTVLPMLSLDTAQSGDGGVSGAVIYTDGGSRGNPGPSAAGYIVINEGIIADQGGEYLGITTNNQAEYHGVRLGLEAAERLGVDSVEMRIDSMLVVNQLKGVYKIKNRELWPINEHIKDIVSRFKRVKFVYVPREMNQLADGMVNRTLDAHKNMI